MIVLPLTSLTEIDQPIFGSNQCQLAKLKRLGFPIPDGIAISAPEFILHTVIKHSKLGNFELIDQELKIEQKKWEQMEPPLELTQILGKHKKFVIRGEIFNQKSQLWKRLIDLWILQIKSNLLRVGYDSQKFSPLTAFSVYFLDEIKMSFIASLDPELRHLDIQSNPDSIGANQKISVEYIEEAREIVENAFKKLFLPYNCTFVVEKNNLYLVDLTPFTQVNTPKNDNPNTSFQQQIIHQFSKSAIKIFANTSSPLKYDQNLDGAIITLKDLNSLDDSLYILSENAAKLNPKPVIYNFSIPDDGDITSGLRLINQPDLVKINCDVVLWLRDKKGLTNLSITLPSFSNQKEYEQIKLILSKLGIKRQTNLQFWLNFSTPENIINLRSYLSIGMDGVILNLNLLHSHFYGYKPADIDLYSNNSESLTEFLDQFFKDCHRSQIPVIVDGTLALNSQNLEYLISKGVWGITSSSEVYAQSLSGQLQWMEGRLVEKRILT